MLNFKKNNTQNCVLLEKVTPDAFSVLFSEDIHQFYNKVHSFGCTPPGSHRHLHRNTGMNGLPCCHPSHQHYCLIFYTADCRIKLRIKGCLIKPNHFSNCHFFSFLRNEFAGKFFMLQKHCFASFAVIFMNIRSAWFCSSILSRTFLQQL